METPSPANRIETLMAACEGSSGRDLTPALAAVLDIPPDERYMLFRLADVAWSEKLLTSKEHDALCVLLREWDRRSVPERLVLFLFLLRIVPHWLEERTTIPGARIHSVITES